jgi:hypothetical protein
MCVYVFVMCVCSVCVCYVCVYFVYVCVFVCVCLLCAGVLCVCVCGCVCVQLTIYVINFGFRKIQILPVFPEVNIWVSGGVSVSKKQAYGVGMYSGFIWL